MADSDGQAVVRDIDWRSTFPFTHVFKGFRVAIHPSKLVLALLALVLIYFGGRLLDGIWSNNSRAVPDEIAIYVNTLDQPNPSAAFWTQRQAARDQLLQDYQNKLAAINKPNGDLGDIKQAILDQRAKDVQSAQQTFDPSKATNEKEKQALQDSRDGAIMAAYDNASAQWAHYHAIRGVGLFDVYFTQQIGQAHRIARDARGGNWIGKGGVFDQIINLLVIGPGWAMRYHPVYFTLFFIWCLVIWAIFGGAIARIAAVHVARDEKISFRSALSFSTAKFLSFVSAPIIPLLIVAVVGIIVSIGGLLFNIPWFGPAIGGALFFLALAAGFVMTLVLIGLLGGFNLMYPTIAVEGSDSFDAISRSFSYLYARPWRLIFYTLVAALYGVACYVFVRYFIKLLLSLTHYFVGLFIFRSAPDQAPVWSQIWPDPLTATRLSYNIDHFRLGVGDDIGAFLIAFWVYLTIAMLGAFAISFYFSANTIIYVLMRREVDATELDDVYLEQGEEDFGETTGGTVASETVATTTSVEAAPAPTAPSPAPSAQPETPSESPAPEAPSEPSPPPESGSEGQPPNQG